MKKLIFVLLLALMAPTVEAMPQVGVWMRHLEWKHSMGKRQREFKRQKRLRERRQQKAIKHYLKRKGWCV